MTEQEHKALRSYCAFILKEYGFQFSPTDPVIPALYIIHREMQLNNQNNRALASIVKDTSSKLNSKVYNFNSSGEALKFQIGAAIKWFLTGLVCLLFVIVGIWYWSIKNNIDRANEILNASDDISKLIQRVKVDGEGFYFLEFKESAGNSIQNFTEFEKVGARTIRVYFGKEADKK